jgi:hypothetical protein
MYKKGIYRTMNVILTKIQLTKKGKSKTSRYDNLYNRHVGGWLLKALACVHFGFAQINWPLAGGSKY